MGIRVYADVFCIPLTDNPPDIYGDAVLSTVNDTSVDLTGALIFAATNDMIGIMRRQYKKADNGSYVFGLPEGFIGTIINPDTSALLQTILGAQHPNTIITITDFKIGTVDTLGSDEYAGYTALDFKLNNSIVGGFYENYVNFLSDGGNANTHLLAGNPLAGNNNQATPSYYDVDSISGHGITYTTYHFDNNLGDYAPESFSTFAPFNPPMVAGETYYTVKYKTTNVNITYYASILATVGNGLLSNITIATFGDYYPIIPLKIDFQWWFDNTDSAYVKNIRKFYKNYNLGKLDKLTDKLIENSTEDNEIDDVFIVNGVNVYSRTDYNNEYMYKFFLELLLNGLIQQSFDNDYNLMNEFTVNELQYEQHILFRQVKRNTITPLPAVITSVTYSHFFDDLGTTANTFWVDDGEHEPVEEFVAGEVQFFSDNKFHINKTVNGVLQEEIIVTGLQFFHIVNVADSGGKTVVVELIPNNSDNLLYDTWQTFINEGGVTEDYTGTVPKIGTIPVIREVINSDTYTIKRSARRNILFSSFHFYFYGSITRYVHWTQDLRSFIFSAITLALQLYQMATLGINIGTAIAKEALLGLVKQMGLSFLKSELFKIIVIKAVGNEELANLILTGFQTAQAIGANFDSNFNFNLSGGLAETLIRLSNAVLKIKITKDSLEFQTKDKDDNIEEEDVILLESVDEFKDRLTSYSKLKEVNLTNHKDGNIKASLGNETNFIFPLNL